MATDYLAPTTELEAVNEILATIGEAPVGTLTGSLPVDAAMALSQLRSRSRSLQTKGWDFNVDYAFTLAQSPDGTVSVPRNALRVDPVSNLDYVVRQGKLYDRANHTFAIGADVQADITRFLPFEDLPEYARQFILISAARRFQDKLLGDDSIHGFTQADERAAWAAFLDAESEQADLNVIRDSTTINRVIRRRPQS